MAIVQAPARRRERYFANVARGRPGGKWSTEDWYFTFSVVGLILLGLWLANNYKPFVEPPRNLVSEEYYEESSY